uniref:S1 motif domain-containing protein n=1 Tax=Alexandrium andersonii TaxID=327968 RepID=A0A7S2ADE0_9DINO
MPWSSARRRSNSARRRGSSLRGQSRDWTHPEGFKLSEVQENAEYEGVVTNVSRRAVFVDFGAERDGILFVPKGVSLRNFKEGTQVKGLQVVSLDLVRDRATLEADLSKVTTNRRQRDEFFHEDGCPLEELRENQAISGGQVTFSNSQVIYVDFGAARDGKLLLPRHLRGYFRVGDGVEGLRVQKVNMEKDEVLLVADNPDRRSVV